MLIAICYVILIIVINNVVKIMFILNYTNMKYNLIRRNVNSPTLWNCVVILFAVGFTRFAFDFRFSFRYSPFPLEHNGTGFRSALAT